MLTTGIKGHKEVQVTEENTAKTYRSGLLDVFATPAMIALVEETCFTSVTEQLEEGMGTVGTLVNIKHVAATPIGMKVTCDSELTEVDGRRLVFTVKASDECGIIGEGTHERFIVDNVKFQTKADSKIK